MNTHVQPHEPIAGPAATRDDDAALRAAVDAALQVDPLHAIVDAARLHGASVRVSLRLVDGLPEPLRTALCTRGQRGPALAVLREALSAQGLPVLLEVRNGAETAWRDDRELWELDAGEGDLDAGESFQLSDDTILLERPDAYYAVRTLPNGGRKEWPVLARPLWIVKWLTVEGEVRVVLEDRGGRFTGTFGEALRRLRENGQAFDPRRAEGALARLQAEAPFAGDAPATYGLVVEEGGRLILPTEFYPRPGHQADAIRDVEPNRTERPQADGWRAWRDFFAYYHPHEWMPLAGLAAIAPAALILRKARVVVAAGYAFSREGETGKTTLSGALSERAYGIQAVSGEAVNSEFRFLGMLDAACLPRLIDEAERLDWSRYGAVLKAAMGAPRAGDRGKKDRTLDSYMSRAVPFFTSNARPPLSPPVLARFLMLAFDDDRKRKSTTETARAFHRAVEQLPPVGPALAAAVVKLHPTQAALLGRHKDVTELIGRARDRWDDTRRPGTWSAVFMGLEAWAEASAGVVAAPEIETFVRAVVGRVEATTFEEPVDALGSLRGWLEVWLQRNGGAGALSGPARLEAMDPSKLTGVRFIEARLATRPLIDAFNREMEKRPDVQFSGLVDVAREVQRQYGAAGLLDSSGSPRLWTMPNGTRQRAVPLPLEGPGTPDAGEQP